MFNVIDESQAADPKNWPACPSCRSRDLIILGEQAKCLSCSYSGTKESVSGNSIFVTLAVNKAIINPKLYNSGIHFGPFPQNAGDEYGDILEERMNQLVQEGLFARYYHQAVGYLKKYNQLPLICIYYEKVGDTPVMLTLKKPPEGGVEQIRRSIIRRGRGCEAIGILFPTDKVVDQSWQTDWNPTGTNVGVNTFMYGRPALTNVQEVFWQPVDWNITTPVRGRMELRYLGLIEVKDDINVTISVRENMDTGATIGMISFRDVGIVSEPARYKTLDGDSVTAIIERAKDNYKRIVDRTLEELSEEAFLFRFEREWDMTIEQPVIMNEICNNELWQISREHMSKNET